jgi:predicted nuclease of predicted toxin-antitoxin system
MRLFLDAHVSGPRVGGPLREKGHDVRALDREPEHEGLDDEDVLALASEDRRILVTHNVADFPEILREWAAGDRSHAGVILVYGIKHSEFGLIVRGIERWLELRPRQDDWVDFPAVVGREFAANA